MKNYHPIHCDDCGVFMGGTFGEPTTQPNYCTLCLRNHSDIASILGRSDILNVDTEEFSSKRKDNHHYTMQLRTSFREINNRYWNKIPRSLRSLIKLMEK